MFGAISFVRVSLFVGLVVGFGVFIVVAPGVVRERVSAALTDVAGANRGWLWLAAFWLIAGLVMMGAVWRAALRLVGGSLTLADATARYATGSMVNAIAPAGTGAATRIALFARALTGADRLWAAGGVAAAVGFARVLVLVLLIVFGATVGALPLWPLLVIGPALGAVGIVIVLGRSSRRARSVCGLSVLCVLRKSPGRILEVGGWTAGAVAMRVAASASVATAFGVQEPLRVALVAIAAFSLAGVVPLIPGSLVGSGAAALALHADGLETKTALLVGIAFQALETAVNIVVGAAGALTLLLVPLPAWTFQAGAATAIAVALGVTVFV